MGLDNGFIVRGLKNDVIPKNIVYNDYSRYNEDDYVEFGYMRKCWGIRDMLVKNYNMSSDDYYHTLKEEDYQSTLDVINHFLCEKNFVDDCASTIWSFKDYKSTLNNNYKALKWLFKYAENHPEVKIVFYDSY